MAQQIEDISIWAPSSIRAIKIDKQGNKIVAGYTSGSTFFIGDSIEIDMKITNYSGLKFFVAKMDKYDQLIWFRHGVWFSDKSSYEGDQVSVEIDNFNNISILYSVGGVPVVSSQNEHRLIRELKWKGNTYDDIDNFLLKLDPQGNEVWHRALYLNKPSRETAKIVVDSQGNTFLCETIMGRKPGVTSGQFWVTIDDKDFTIQEWQLSNTNTGVVTVKFDLNGKYVWSRGIVDVAHGTILEDIVISADDDISLYTSSYGGSGTISFKNFDTFDDFNNPNSAGSCLVTYNPNGEVLDYGVIEGANGGFGQLKLFYLKNKLFAAGRSFPFLSVLELENYRNVVHQDDYVRNGSGVDQYFEVKDFVVDRAENKYIIARFLPYSENVKFGNTVYPLETKSGLPMGQIFLLKHTKSEGLNWGINLGLRENYSNVMSHSKRPGLTVDDTGYIYVSGLYIKNKELAGQLPFVPCYNCGLNYVMKIRDTDFVDSPHWFEGKTFSDRNFDCEPNSSDMSLPHTLILKNGQYYTISDKKGSYFIPNENDSVVLESKILNSDFYKYIPSQNNCDTIKQVVIKDLQLQDPNSINFGYKVKPCSYLTIDLTNERRRRCFMSSTTVEYQNQGFATAQNVEVKVEYPDYIFPVSSSPAWTRKEGNSYFFNVGSLAAGNAEKIIFQDSVICGIEAIRGLTQCVKATISPANMCEDWTDNENKYEISGRCVGGGVARYTIKNLTNTSTDSIPYRLYANSKVFAERNTLLPANGEVEIEVFTNGMTMRMELFPQNHDPISAFVEGCQVAIPYKTKAENPNPVVSVAPVQQSGVALPQNDGGERSETSCSEILDSYDPNDKQVVPFGLTNENLIEKTTELDYTIRFQNTGTIEAVNIVVLDTLSEFLDIETIRLGMVSHDYKLLIDGDADTRVLRFEFDNINLPDSNSNEPASHGFIKFKIKQKANNSIGTVIKNRAAIYFDFNSPIITNTISNKVAVLPLTNSNLNLPVFNCSDANFELVANAGNDIETTNSTATLAAQATQVFGSWSLLSGFGELENASKNNSKVTGLLPFPTKLVWRVAVCGEAKQDTVIVQSTNTDYKFTIDFNETEATLSVPTGKVTYQWYRDGVLITGQTGAKLDLSTLENRIGVYTVVISSGDTSITSEPFTIDKILSNDDFIKANYIKIYPNPTTSLLNVELNTVLNASEVILVNALGMELQKTLITNSNKITLDLNNLSNGIYFVKIVSQKGIFYKKVVLKK
ncbi:T9SS type A sorting domain-containing protein [Bernardetia sp. MNP-M8]|uniref:T9SS type A sorting domain-containing protein n=1 Tax=Bernardetia sp. MNP-M8 TaxID=3127470 RepID=UPI0030CD4A0C